MHKCVFCRFTFRSNPIVVLFCTSYHQLGNYYYTFASTYCHSVMLFFAGIIHAILKTTHSNPVVADLKGQFNFD